MKYVKIRWKLKRFFQFTRHETPRRVVFAHQLSEEKREDEQETQKKRLKEIRARCRSEKRISKELKHREDWNRPKRVKGIKKNKVENGENPSPVCLALTLLFLLLRHLLNSKKFVCFHDGKKEIAAATNAQSCCFSSIHPRLFLLAKKWKAIIHCYLTITEMNLN